MSHSHAPLPSSSAQPSNPEIIVDPLQPLSPVGKGWSWNWYRLAFIVSTLLEMVVAGMTVYLAVEVGKYHKLTYSANLYDLINTTLGLLYQLITLIEEHRGGESSLTHLRIIIPSLVLLVISGIASVILSTISLVHDYAQRDTYKGLSDLVIGLLTAATVCNYIITLLHLICLVHLIHRYNKHKHLLQDNSAISLTSLHRQSHNGTAEGAAAVVA